MPRRPRSKRPDTGKGGAPGDDVEREEAPDVGKNSVDNVPHLRAVLAKREAENGPESLQSSAAANALADQLLRTGGAREAEALFRRVLASCERALGPEDVQTLAGAANLANCLAAVGKRAEAEEVFQRVAEVAPPDGPLRHTALGCIAGLLAKRGKLHEAERVYRETLALRESELGVQHLETLAAMNNLGLVLRSFGRNGEAEVHLRRAFELLQNRSRDRGSAKDGPEMWLCLDSLAWAVGGQGRHAEAESLSRKAGDALERVLGEDHPCTLASVGGRARHLEGLGKHKESEVCYRRALVGLQRYAGAGDADTLRCAGGLAALLNSHGGSKERLQEAERLARRQFVGLGKEFGEGHPEVLSAAELLATILRKASKHQEAENCLQTALGAGQKQLGKGHVAVASIHAALAVHFETCRRINKEADRHFAEAIESLDAMAGADHDKTLDLVSGAPMLFERYRDREPADQEKLPDVDESQTESHPFYQNEEHDGRRPGDGFLDQIDLDCEQGLVGNDATDDVQAKSEEKKRIAMQERRKREEKKREIKEEQRQRGERAQVAAIAAQEAWKKAKDAETQRMLGRRLCHGFQQVGVKKEDAEAPGEEDRADAMEEDAAAEGGGEQEEDLVDAIGWSHIIEEGMYDDL